MLLLRKIFSLSTLTLLTAFTLSGIAAWYSIVGLTAIFAAAVIPVIIMGAALETAKVVTTMWLHKFWNGSGLLLKLYLIPAVVVLALITSMGIFGFLSRAHLEQTQPAGNNSAKIERIDLQVVREKRTIQDAEKIISQLDQTVQVLMDAQRIRGPDGALAVRKGQQAERDSLTNTINQAQNKIDQLEDEKFELNIAVRNLKLEVGPLKYVAALIYEDAESNLENAVRIVIILLVVVFDPLALCLVIASLKAREIEYAEIENKYKKVVVVPSVTEIEEEIDYGECNKCGTKLLNVPAIGPFCPNKECDVLDGPFEPEESIVEELVEEHTKCGTPECCGTCDTAEIVDTDIPQPDEESTGVIQFDPEEEIKKKTESIPEVEIEPVQYDPVVVDDSVPETVEKGATYQEVDGGYVIYEDKMYKKEALREIKPNLFLIKPDDNIKSNSGFGSQFPKTAFKGDIFVRVDLLPNKVFKFDGQRWIEVNKTNTDVYLYDTEYVKYLIERISKGEYDIELLSDNERYQIEEYLKTQGSQDK